MLLEYSARSVGLDAADQLVSAPALKVDVVIFQILAADREGLVSFDDKYRAGLQRVVLSLTFKPSRSLGNKMNGVLCRFCRCARS